MPSPGPFDVVAEDFRNGRLDAAEAGLRVRLGEPAHMPEAARLLGHVFLRRGDRPAARDWLSRAVAASPANGLYWNDLGVVERLLGSDRAAADAFERSVECDPSSAEAWHNLGMTCRALHDFARARAAFERCIALAPGAVPSWTALGMTESDAGDLERAHEVFARVVDLAPRDATAWLNLGFCRNLRHDLAGGEKALRMAIELDPKLALAHQHLGENLVRQGDWMAALDALEESAACDPGSEYALSSMALLRLGVPDETGESLLALARRAAAVLSPAGPPVVHAARSRPRKLRVGFLSSDFRRHSCAYFLEPLVSAIDRERFSTVAFAQFSRTFPDRVTHRIAATMDDFIDVSKMPDPELARTIRNTGIDVLVDIGGHTHGSRTTACRFKPAPSIVAWLGYPASTGIPEIDGRIGDDIVDPAPLADAHFSERLIRLPGPFLCYAGPEEDVAVSPPPNALRGFVTFGMFNNSNKINGSVASAWARILGRTPRARLLVKIDMGTRPRAAGWVRRVFADAGIPPDRLEIIDHTPAGAAYFASYARIDIALDPFPYNGTTTTFESLWMGVPVVTLAGSRHSARVGASILTHLGCPELVARDVDDYVDRAVALAGDPARLAGYRVGLRSRLQGSPLMDRSMFARNFEAALDGAFDRAMAGL